MDSSSRTLHSPFKPIYFQIAAAEQQRCVLGLEQRVLSWLWGLDDGE